MQNMRTHLFLKSVGLLVLLCAFLAGPALAYHRCILCGMDVDKSETAFYAKMKNGKMAPLCSMQCLYMLEMNAKEKAVSVRTEIYPTARSTDAKKAFYLCESKQRPKGTMAPFMLAFATREKAEEYQKKYGGRILNFDEAMEFVKQSMPKKK